MQLPVAVPGRFFTQSQVRTMTSRHLLAVLLLLAPCILPAQNSQFSTKRTATVRYAPGGPQQNGYESATVEVRYRLGECFGTVDLLYQLIPSSVQAHRFYWFDGERKEVPETIRPPQLLTIRFAGSIGGLVRGPSTFSVIASESPTGCVDREVRLGALTEYWAKDATAAQRLHALNSITVAETDLAPVLTSTAVETNFRTARDRARRELSLKTAEARRDSLARAQAVQARRDSIARATAERDSRARAQRDAAAATARQTQADRDGQAAARRDQQERAAAAQRQREAEETARQIEEVTRRNAERRAQSDAAVDQVMGGVNAMLDARERQRRASEAREEDATARYYASRDAIGTHPVCTIATAEWVVLSVAPIRRAIDNRECQAMWHHPGDQFLVRVPDRGRVTLEVSGTGFPPQLRFMMPNGRELKELSNSNSLDLSDRPRPQARVVRAQGIVDAGVYLVEVSSAKFPEAGPYSLVVNGDAPRSLPAIGGIVRYAKVWGQGDGAFLPAANREYTAKIDARLTARVGIEVTFDHPPIVAGGAAVEFTCAWKAPDGSVVWTRTLRPTVPAGWVSFSQSMLTRPGEISAWVPGNYRVECSSQGRSIGEIPVEIVGTTGTASVAVESPLSPPSPPARATVEPETSAYALPALKAKLTAVLFFEQASGPLVPAKDRVYATRFDPGMARMIGVRLEFAMPALPADTTIGPIKCVWIGPDEAIVGTRTWRVNVAARSTKIALAGTFGWPAPGNWPLGRHRVDCTTGERKIGSGNFEIGSP